MNNMTKSFKTKSKLRCMADGGIVQGMAARKAAIDNAGAVPVAPAPVAAAPPSAIDTAAAGYAAQRDAAQREWQAMQTPKPPPTPVKKSGLRGFFGLADGGQVFESNPGGVRTFSDQRTAGSGVYTPGANGRGTFSTLGNSAAAPSATTPPLAAPSPIAATPKLGKRVDDFAQSALSGAFQSAFAPSANPVAPPVKPPLDAGSQLPSFGSPVMGAFNDGGPVKGPGGPTDDKVGPVMLSNDEYVLPADTVKAVGKENLDALRAQTHQFTGKSQLRGMADGGMPFDEQLRRVMRPGTAPMSSLSRELAPVPRPAFAPPPVNATRALPPPAGSRTLAVPSRELVPRAAASKALVPGAAGSRALATVPKPPVNKLAGAAGGAAIAGIAGAVQSYDDLGSGYRDRFNAQMGVGGPIGATIADTARTLANVGDAATGDMAGRVGRGLASKLGGGTFGDGYVSPRNPSADFGQAVGINGGVRGGGGANIVPSFASAKGGSVFRDGDSDTAMGKLRNGQPLPAGWEQSSQPGIYGRGREFIGVGQPPQGDPMMDEFRSALRAMGQSGGGNARMPRYDNDNANAINKKYDDLLSSGSGRSIKHGLDWSQRHGLDVEKSRASALGEDYRTQTGAQASALRAQTDAAQIDVAKRAQELGALGGMLDIRSRDKATEQQREEALLRALYGGKPEKPEKVKPLTDDLDREAKVEGQGDKALTAQIRSQLSNISEADRQALEALPDGIEREQYLSALRGIDGAAREGATPGVDRGAQAANAAVGAAIGVTPRLPAKKWAAGKLGKAGAAADKLLSKVPRVGKLSKLRLMERLGKGIESGVLPALAGGSYGAFSTPEEEQMPTNQLMDFPKDANGEDVYLNDNASYLTRARRDGPIDAMNFPWENRQVYNKYGVLVDDPRIGEGREELATDRSRLRALREKAMRGGE